MTRETSEQPPEIAEVLARWQETWPTALQLWNPYVSLREPQWCLTTAEAREAGLQDSFAMIRLRGLAVVVDLETVRKLRVENYALQVLAHEIGHHLLVPANLYDYAGLMMRVRLALAGIEDRAPLVANLYADLLINDRLQRTMGQDMASLYRHLREKGIGETRIFLWYRRIYELLWSLPRGFLSCDKSEPVLDADASLGASVLRSFARDWLDGAGRFAMLAYPYLIEDALHQQALREFAHLSDITSAGVGAELPAGMAEIPSSVFDGIVDPREEVLQNAPNHQEADSPGRAKPGSLTAIIPGSDASTGPQQRYMQPGIYVDLMRQIHPDVDEDRLIGRYYRDVVTPHLVPFPIEALGELSGDVLPEGTDPWEPGDPIEDLDWFESALLSPIVIPGVTTRRRVYAEDIAEPEKEKPYHLYVGIDCSGSMHNPRRTFSWPVCAGALVSLSALRVGARVMACLSGEPGSFMETRGFIKEENEVLRVLTSYLGTGYAFGIPRLETEHLQNAKEKTHLLIVTDDDIFSMLAAPRSDGQTNYDIAEQALRRAGGGGTLVLHARAEWRPQEAERLRQMGWVIHYVTDENALFDFAKAFANRFYRSQGNPTCKRP